MLGLKLNHVSKRGHRQSRAVVLTKLISGVWFFHGKCFQFTFTITSPRYEFQFIFIYISNNKRARKGAYVCFILVTAAFGGKIPIVFRWCLYDPVPVACQEILSHFFQFVSKVSEVQKIILNLLVALFIESDVCESGFIFALLTKVLGEVVLNSSSVSLF